MNYDIRQLTRRQLTPDLLQNFSRYQQVTHCWRKQEGAWVLLPIPFVENWGEEEKKEILTELRLLLSEGGRAAACWAGEELVGFAALEGQRTGSRGQYQVLHLLYTHAAYRGRGIGGALLRRCARWAWENGAQKLYISAHSSRESTGFYLSQGCVDAQEQNPRLTALEPCDRQLELQLSPFLALENRM